MPKKRVYQRRLLGNQVMTPKDLENLHKHLLELLGTIMSHALLGGLHHYYVRV